MLLMMSATFAYDWSFTDYEFCSAYDPESFDAETDFTIKCLDDNEEVVYLEDYLNKL